MNVKVLWSSEDAQPGFLKECLPAIGSDLIWPERCCARGTYPCIIPRYPHVVLLNT